MPVELCCVERYLNGEFLLTPCTDKRLIMIPVTDLLVLILTTHETKIFLFKIKAYLHMKAKSSLVELISPISGTDASFILWA